MSKLYIDDSFAKGEGVQLVTPFGRRVITHAIHDIDGTHSLIRNWQPVMSICMDWAIHGGLSPDFDSDEHTARLIKESGTRLLPETDSYCIECAGFSAITQMEYAIRRAVEEGSIDPAYQLVLSPTARENNSRIIKRIWQGEETFNDIEEPPELTKFLAEFTPRLFRQYEKVLNGACRDRNLADARNNPTRWRVPGSLEFITRLSTAGCINYFVTGAVIYSGGGMLEEVETLGYKVGPGEVIHSLQGSSWDKKMPKDEVIHALFHDNDIDPASTLVIGDGRTEIKAGVQEGAVTISRLAKGETRQREIHTSLGTNMIIEDYTSPLLAKMIYRA